MTVSLNQTWVHVPNCNKAHLLTPGCSEGKCNVYCRVPSKESRQLVFKRPNSLKAFRERLLLLFFTLFYFTILYWFCHTSTWISHRCTCVPNPEPRSHLPPHTISVGHPSAPAPSILYPVSNLDWQFVSYMILYMFQCHSPKSSHPLLLPQSPKVCSIHLCLFCCLTYRVIITIFLNSIYMC